MYSEQNIQLYIWPETWYASGHFEVTFSVLCIEIFMTLSFGVFEAQPPTEYENVTLQLLLCDNRPNGI
jgi:hypothetical protein